MCLRIFAVLLLSPVLVWTAPLPREKPPKPKTPGEVIVGQLKHEGDSKYSFVYTTYTQRPEDRKKVVTEVVDGVVESYTVNYRVLIPEAKQIKLDLPNRGSKFIDVKGESISDEELKKKCKTGTTAVILRTDQDAEWCKFLADDIVIIEMSTGQRIEFGSSPGLFDTKNDLPPVVIK